MSYAVAGELCSRCRSYVANHIFYRLSRHMLRVLVLSLDRFRRQCLCAIMCRYLCIVRASSSDITKRLYANAHRIKVGTKTQEARMRKLNWMSEYIQLEWDGSRS